MDFKQLNKKLQIFIEMSPNLRRKDTNLPVIIYVSPQQGSHGPRIKFMNKYSDKWIKKEEITISIEDNPQIKYPPNVKLKISNKDFKKIQQWIIQNKQVLLDFWFGEIKTEEELKQKLTKLDIV